MLELREFFKRFKVESGGCETRVVLTSLDVGFNARNLWTSFELHGSSRLPLKSARIFQSIQKSLEVS